MENLEEIISSILFVSGEGVDIDEICEKLNISRKEMDKTIDKMKASGEDKGIQLIKYKNKIQLSSNPKYVSFVEEVLNPIKEKQLTRAVLEVAAIVAYKQPITRLEIENVRGVNSDYAVNLLIDNNLIEVVGRKDAIGKPLLFGTTETFLKKFGLESIAELPDYNELLERIRVIEQPQETSLLHFEDYSERDDIKNAQPADSAPETPKEEENSTKVDDDIPEEFTDEYIKSLFNKNSDIVNEFVSPEEEDGDKII